MATDNNTIEYSLEAFLKDHIIVIPAMQRDYAQGRDNAEATTIRRLFISSILDAVLSNNELSLDFTYGDSFNNDLLRYYPVDGQQRLTTLFLVYAYVLMSAIYEKDRETTERLKVLGNFRFEERPIAEEYIMRLLSSECDLPRLTMPELWHESPTAEGLSRTYSMIVDMFEKNKSLKEEELLERLEKVTFMEIDSNLPEDVFCKMNARGRSLTDFEVFKASVVKKFNNEVSNAFVRDANEFYEKLFEKKAKQEGDIDKSVTETIMRIIRSWFAFLECPTDNKEETISCDNLDDYIAFDNYFEKINTRIDGVDDIYAITALSSFFEFFSKDIDYQEELIYLLPARKKTLENNTRRFSEILAACIAFFGGRQERTSKENLKDWIRFVCNILDNTTNSLERTKMFVSIGKGKDIKEGIKAYPEIEKAPALNTQLNEEKQKLNLIECDKCWKEPIDEAENLDILEGRISLLLNIDNANESIEAFKTYFNCLKKLWDGCIEGDERKGTRFTLSLLPYYEEELPKTWIPVKFASASDAKDILYNSLPGTFKNYIENKKSAERPYWIDVLCGENGEELIKATCSESKGYVSDYHGYPVLWAKYGCTWHSYNNVVLSKRNEYIYQLLKNEAVSGFRLSNKDYNSIRCGQSYLPYFFKEWEILLTYKGTYYFRTEDWQPEKIFLLDKNKNEIVRPVDGKHYCISIENYQKAINEAEAVIAEAKCDGHLL